MALIQYVAKLAVDKDTGLPLPELQGQGGTIIKRGQPSAIPTIYEDDEGNLAIPGSVMSVDGNGFVPSFYVDEDDLPISWWNGATEVPLESVEGVAKRMEEIGAEVTVARVAAEDAAQAAQDAADLVEAPADDAVATLIGDTETLTGAAIDELRTTNGARPVGKGELVVNAKDFGATGDGITDDTVAMTDWLDSLVANGGEGYLPPGIYRVTSSLVRTDDPPPLTIRGAGSTQSYVYGDFIGADQGIIGVDAFDHSSGHHSFYGIGLLGNGVPGDPIGLLLTDAFECTVEDIDARHGVNGPWSLANSVVVCTNDNNSKFRNIRSQGGWQPQAFPIATSVNFSFSTASTTITATAAVFVAGMVGEPIYFNAGSDTGAHAVWRANIVSVAPDGLSCVIDQNPPSTQASVKARVGYVTGSVSSGSDQLVLNNVSGLSSDYVGMQVHVIDASTKTDAGSTKGLLSTHITAVSGSTITLAADATNTVVNAIVLFAPAVFMGQFEEYPDGVSQQTNHSWWSNVQLEGFRAAGLIVNKALYVTIDNLKLHGASYPVSGKWGESYYWAVFSEIKGVTIQGVQASFSVAGEKIHVSGSRGILTIRNSTVNSMYKDVPVFKVADVTTEFTLVLTEFSFSQVLTGFSPNYRFVSAPLTQNVEFSGAVQERGGTNRLSQSGSTLRRGITAQRGWITIPDDTVYTFKPEGDFGMLQIAASSLGNSGIVWYRTSDAPAGGATQTVATLGNVDTVASEVDATGTTGTDGKLTVTADTGGNLRIENRRGISLNVALVCAPFGE